MSNLMSDTPPRSAHFPPGYDENDPYADEDLETYPIWWRRNIEEFTEHGMRPYRPPRFSDGEFTPEVITRLEEELDVTIQFRNINPQSGNEWKIWVDGDPLKSVPRTREPEGFSEYGIESEEFEAIIRNNVSQ